MSTEGEPSGRVDVWKRSTDLQNPVPLILPTSYPELRLDSEKTISRSVSLVEFQGLRQRSQGIVLIYDKGVRLQNTLSRLTVDRYLAMTSGLPTLIPLSTFS